MQDKNSEESFSEKTKDKALKLFKDFLKKKGLKITKERNRLFEFILNITDHFDVESLERSLKEQNIEASRATIYRTLDLLVASKLVNKIDFGDARAYYEYAYGQAPHYHLICRSCFSIIEFFSKDIESLYYEICKKYKFNPVDHIFKIYGLCQNCSQSKKPDYE